MNTLTGKIAIVTGQIISVDGGLTAHMPTYADLQRRLPGAFQIKKQEATS